jgi:hypothetical protein
MQLEKPGSNLRDPLKSFFDGDDGLDVILLDGGGWVNAISELLVGDVFEHDDGVVDDGGLGIGKVGCGYGLTIEKVEEGFGDSAGFFFFFFFFFVLVLRMGRRKS